MRVYTNVTNAQNAETTRATPGKQQNERMTQLPQGLAGERDVLAALRSAKMDPRRKGYQNTGCMQDTLRAKTLAGADARCSNARGFLGVAHTM